jgi:thymidine kinase
MKHSFKGKITMHIGSMFSGKSSALRTEAVKLNIAKCKVLTFKPIKDDRYCEDEVCTHDKLTLQAIKVNSIYKLYDIAVSQNVDVVAIDELQMFEDYNTPAEIVENILDLREKGIGVIIAGLDIDFAGVPFESIKELMPYANYIEKHHAVCVNCGDDAYVSHRKTSDKERTVVGDETMYEPLCYRCSKAE